MHRRAHSVCGGEAPRQGKHPSGGRGHISIAVNARNRDTPHEFSAHVFIAFVLAKHIAKQMEVLASEAH